MKKSYEGWLIKPIKITKEIHVIPENDLKEHITSKDCLCNPTEQESLSQEDMPVWMHNSYDYREIFSWLSEKGIDI